MKDWLLYTGLAVALLAAVASPIGHAASWLGWW